jgi:hypothetical protein
MTLLPVPPLPLFPVGLDAFLAKQVPDTGRVRPSPASVLVVEVVDDVTEVSFGDLSGILGA